MLNNILNLKGVSVLKKNEQQSISGGLDYLGSQCESLCAGSCSFGYCYQILD